MRQQAPQEESCHAFGRLALDLFALQFEHNGPYRRLCEARGARPDNVTHWTAIPAVPTSAFKELELSCLPVGERTTVFHSSGTTGQRPSRHFHNAESLALYEASLLGGSRRTSEWQMANGKWQSSPRHRHRRRTPRWCTCSRAIRREAGSGVSAFVGRVAEDGAWALDLEAALERLRAASASGQPLLMLGHRVFVCASAGLPGRSTTCVSSFRPARARWKPGATRAARAACRRRRCTRSSRSASASRPVTSSANTA